MPKTFHIGDVLSATTGRLISLRHMEGVYEILNYMTGRDLFDHQLPEAMDACEPYLLEQFPWLSELSEPVEDLVKDIIKIRSWGTSKKSNKEAIDKMMVDWFACLDHPKVLSVRSISELKEAN